MNLLCSLLIPLTHPTLFPPTSTVYKWKNIFSVALYFFHLLPFSKQSNLCKDDFKINSLNFKIEHMLEYMICVTSTVPWSLFLGRGGALDTAFSTPVHVTVNCPCSVRLLDIFIGGLLCIVWVIMSLPPTHHPIPHTPIPSLLITSHSSFLSTLPVPTSCTGDELLRLWIDACWMHVKCYLFV